MIVTSDLRLETKKPYNYYRNQKRNPLSNREQPKSPSIFFLFLKNQNEFWERESSMLDCQTRVTY